MTNKVAVITPYKAQVVALKNALGVWLRSNGHKMTDIEVNTVDAF